MSLRTEIVYLTKKELDNFSPKLGPKLPRALNELDSQRAVFLLGLLARVRSKAE